MSKGIGGLIGTAIVVGGGLWALNTLNKMSSPRVHDKLDYCPRCKKRTKHIKDADEKMCVKCGYREKLNLNKSFLDF